MQELFISGQEEIPWLRKGMINVFTIVRAMNRRLLRARYYRLHPENKELTVVCHDYEFEDPPFISNSVSITFIHYFFKSLF